MIKNGSRLVTACAGPFDGEYVSVFSSTNGVGAGHGSRRKVETSGLGGGDRGGH